MTQTTTAVPDGCRRNAQGHFVPISTIKPIDLERDQLVTQLVGEAQSLSTMARESKLRAMERIRDFVEKSAKTYKIKLGGEIGNVTLHSFDGGLKIQFAVQQHMQFDEQIQAARALIHECANEWTQGARDEVKVIIESAFQTNAEGMLSTSKVLALRKLNIKHPKWVRAMDAISNSLTVVGSREYLRFYKRLPGESKQYIQITMDFSNL